jgi:uncharacterized protein YodC (DUF2158 family)
MLGTSLSADSNPAERVSAISVSRPTGSDMKLSNMYPSKAISIKLQHNGPSIIGASAEHINSGMFMLTKQTAIAIAATLGSAFAASWAVPALSEPAQSKTAMESHTTSLQAGDLVRLRSGGPLMIVKSVQGDQVTCSWSEEGGKLQSSSFSIAMLTAPVTPPPPDPNLKDDERADRYYRTR